MSKTYRHDSRYESLQHKPRWIGHHHHHNGQAPGDFRCRHCKLMVGPVPSGGHQRNHCPHCLYSRHVDGKIPGDRHGGCGALMAPTGAFSRPNGEQVVLHHCLGCGFERYNRLAADDNYLTVMRLPLIAPPALDLRSERRRA